MTFYLSYQILKGCLTSHLIEKSWLIFKVLDSIKLEVSMRNSYCHYSPMSCAQNPEQKFKIKENHLVKIGAINLTGAELQWLCCALAFIMILSELGEIFLCL